MVIKRVRSSLAGIGAVSIVVLLLLASGCSTEDIGDTDEADDSKLAAALPTGVANSPDPRLDLDDFQLVFAEEFDRLDVSSRRETPSRWIAHTPWNGDFGDAVFTDPDHETGFPFSTESGVLSIQARRDDTGQWRSGLLSTVDNSGAGYREPYGYFEARMKVPSGPGVWPAFWLNTYQPDAPWAVEIDVIEHYGHAPDSYQAAWHVWDVDPATNSATEFSADVREIPLDGPLAGEFHDFGVDVTARSIVFYLDRREVWRVDTPEQMVGLQLFPMVNLALGSGWPIDRTPDPSVLEVDHVRIYVRREVTSKD